MGRCMKKEVSNSTLAAEAPLAPGPGPSVRSLRRRRNLTLDQLAEEVGLSKGHLSRFERGEKSLSVSALMRLAKALGTSVSTLLGEHEHADLMHVVRATERPMRQAATAEGKYEYAALSPPGDLGSSAFVVRLAPDVVRRSDAHHGGNEMLFVLSGAVEIELPTKSMLLRQGDFGQFPGQVRHHLRGLEEGTEVLVIVVDSQA